MKPAKIVSLNIENVMRIKAAHIEPSSNVVILGGRNAQGKTSVLDAISMAIGVRKLCPDMPIREGEDTASIEVQLGEMFITRTFKRDGAGGIVSNLKVKNAEGQPLSPPQATLDALTGRLAFDPLEFARMTPAAARETLRALVGLDVEQLEDELGRVFRQRTEAGVAKRAAQAVVDDLPVPPEPTLILPTMEITKEMAAAGQRQADYEELKGIEQKHITRIEELRQRQARLVAQIDELQCSVEAIDKTLDVEENARALASSAVNGFSLPGVEEIQQRLDLVLQGNEKAGAIQRERERYAAKVAEAEVAAEKWKTLDTQHNQIAHDIKQMTEAVTYPIEDLELRKEGVFYQGVPFDQGSRAERIKVSLAMGMAMNDKLRILLIRDGSVLDDESMGVLAMLAEKHDFQFWIEMARGYEGAAGAVVIEDGGVV